MKKIFAFLLTATMLCTMFAVPSLADDNVNYAEDIPFVEVAPVADGIVNPGEYGNIEAQHSYSKNPEQFIPEFDTYEDWDVLFYSAWDAENIYLAWEIVSENGHVAFMPEEDFNKNGSFEEDDYRWMWEYSCVQFIFTPGAPSSEVDYTNNYLEVGLALTANGNVARTIWNYPVGVSSSEININSWSAAIVQDGNKMTYEVAIPKALSGLASFGTDVSFGFSYAAAAQEQFSSVGNGMLEWQDACLGNGGVKQPNNCGIVTLAGGNVEQDNINEQLTAGTLPEEANGEGITQIAIDKLNAPVNDGGCMLITDLDMFYNGANSLCALLLPVEGAENTYKVAEVLNAPGAEPVFGVEPTEGSIILVTNLGTVENGPRYNTVAATLTLDAEVKLFGVDVAKGDLLYTNPTIYSTVPVEVPEYIPEGGDNSGDETPDASEPVDDGDDESADDGEDSVPEEDENTSGDDFNAGDDANEEEGGNSLILFIIIGVVVVAVIVVVVVVVLKKKKND